MLFNKESLNFKNIKNIKNIKNLKSIKGSKYTITGVIILIIAVLYFATNGSTIEEKNLSIKYKGDEYLYLGEYDKAINEYSKIRSDKTKDNKAEALKNIYIANAYSLKGDSENYKKYIQQAKALDSKDDEVISKIVFNEFINGDGSQDLDLVEQRLVSNPHNKSLIKTLVAVYMANNKVDKAKELLKSYQIDSSSAYDLAEYGGMLITLGDLDAGLAKLKEAWDIDKDEYKIYDVLSQTSLYNSEKVSNAIIDLQKKSPNEVAYKLWLAKVYSLSKEKSEDGMEILSKLNSKDAGNIEIKLIEASLLQNMDKTEESDKLISEVIENNKDDYRVLHTAGWFYLNKNQLDKAEEYCKSSIKKNPNYPDNYAFLMPEILKAENKPLLLKAYLRTALEKEPYNYNILASIADFYWYDDENTGKALKYYNLANTIKPDEPELKYNLALLYYNEGKNEEAIKSLIECIKLNEDSTKYHRTLGTIYLTMGSDEEGIKEIRTAYRLDDSDILTLNNAGCYYAIYTDDIHRGYYNLLKAMEGIKEDTDEYTKKVITENYNKIKSIIKIIDNGKANQSIRVPDFRLLY